MLVIFQLNSLLPCYFFKQSSDEKYEINYNSFLELGHLAAYDADPRLCPGW